MSLQSPAPVLVLASASPARQALLTQAGLRFEVCPAGVDESEIKRSARAEGLSVDDAAVLLAELKALKISRRFPDALVIGCDQILLFGDMWFDKPADVDEARQHLSALRGNAHTLITAVVCARGGIRVWHHIARPRLSMRDFSDRFLDLYLQQEGDAVTATVGCYRLEGFGMHLFNEIDGEHAAVLGLPMMALLGFLRQCGVIVT